MDTNAISIKRINERRERNPMITLYISNCRQNEKNTIYPKKVEIGSVFDLKTAVSNDYVCARYKGSKRGNDNFVESDCLPFDIDNDHTEDEGKWIKPSDIAAKFPDVEFFVHYSRNNMKEKEGKKPRPKFHVFFKCAKCSDKDDYIRLKNLFYKFFPYVDDNALDAARFFYGTENPEVEYFSGELGIDDFLSIYSLNDMSYEIDENGEVIDSNDIASNKEVVREEIGEGSRNATMFKLARKFIWRHDDTDFAYSLFLEQAKYCNPPLSDAELSNIWKSNQAYLARMKANGKYIPPQEYFKKNAILKTLKPKDFTDLGQAEVMAKYFNGKIAYSNATGFLVYKDNYWQEDPVFSKRCAQIMTDKQLEEAKNQLFSAKQKLEQYAGATVDLTAAMKNGTDPQILKLASEVEEAKAYENYILKRRNSAKLQSSLEELKPLVQVYVKDLDKDAFLLSTPTKTYDLRKGIEGAMNPDAKNMITKSTTLSPSLKGKDKWLDFLNECFNDDQELIDYVQRICGLAAIGKVYIEGIIISYGDGGNGKSTFWNTIARVLGSYYGKISADALTTNCKRNVKPELAELRGKRLIIASESQEGARLNDSEIKELCSTDDIRAEKKFKDPFDFTPTHTLVLYTNHLPKVKGTDDGIWRRIIVIPFNHKFTKDNADIKNYSDVLYEEAGEFVLTWVIEGARKAYESNFRLKNPAIVQKAIDSYKKENDWFGRFIEECCIVGEEEKCKSNDLYQRYRDFSVSQGERPKGTIEFYTELERHQFKRIQLKDADKTRKYFVFGLSINDAKNGVFIDDFDILN